MSREQYEQLRCILPLVLSIVSSTVIVMYISLPEMSTVPLSPKIDLDVVNLF